MNPTRQFGGFDLFEKIGTGGMATVYRGVQRSLDRPCVIKILHPHLSEDQSLIVRFEREARAAAHLRHENIVQVIDCGREESTSYIAMEFVDGMDLKRLMETYGPPPIEMAALILRDICRGMEHAHQHRVIHRDIKPANLMLTPDGTIKIMDFGLARRGEDSVGMTATGAVLGTPAYMSPEQAMGERVDERSDIFSLGVVGYEMFGGRRPFPGDSYASVLNAILSVTPEPLDRLNPQVPPEIVRVISRMLEKDLAHRYQSISDVRDELETIVERMGLVRGKDLLRRYAAAPAAVTQTLNGVRAPGATLTVSTAVAELLTRGDPLATRSDTPSGSAGPARGPAAGGADTVVLSPDGGNGTPGVTEVRGGTMGVTGVRGGPAGVSGVRDPAPGVTASRESGAAPGFGGGTAGRSVAGGPVEETVAESIPARQPPPRWSAPPAFETAKPKLSKGALIGIGAGAAAFIGIAVAIFIFAGPRHDDVLKDHGVTVRTTGQGDSAHVEINVGGRSIVADGEGNVKMGQDDKAATAGNAGDESGQGGLADARPGDLNAGGRGRSGTVPGTDIPPPRVPDRETLRRQLQRQVDDATAAANRLRQAAGNAGLDAGTVGATRKYLINSKPFAFIYVDGGSKPVNAEGKPVTITLKVGRHSFHAVNNDLVPPVDVMFHYDVEASDINNSLILNLGTQSVEARKNATLPF